MSTIPTHEAARYVQPLREGGSLPAVVETDAAALWVVKFRGAGQGAKVLVSELVVGLLARAAGLPVPELALIELGSEFGRGERDSEIQELLRKSEGLNVGMRYLDGAFNFDPSAAGGLVTPELAARVVWLDAYLTNPDRTPRNPNLMIWQRTPWLIDHGAALYAQHDWASVDDARTRTPFPLIKDHVLLERSGDLAVADREMSEAVGSALDASLDAVPDAFLESPEFGSAGEARDRYRAYLTRRLEGPREFVAEAERARERLRVSPRASFSDRR